MAGNQAVVSVTPSLDPEEGPEPEAATVTTTFPAGIVPQSGTFTTNGYSCTTTGQVVSCQYTPASPIAAGDSLPTVEIPVSIAAGAAAGSYQINAKVSSNDANPATASRTVTVSRFTAIASTRPVPGSTAAIGSARSSPYP